MSLVFIPERESTWNNEKGNKITFLLLSIVEALHRILFQIGWL